MEKLVDTGITDTYSDPGNTMPLVLCDSDLKQFAGWAGFMAIMEILAGILACLGVITAIFGIPMLMSGVKLMGAADELKRYTASNGNRKITMTMEKLHKYFKLAGISAILKICFIFLVLLLYAFFILFVLPKHPDFIDFTNLPFHWSGL